MNTPSHPQTNIAEDTPQAQAPRQHRRKQNKSMGDMLLCSQPYYTTYGIGRPVDLMELVDYVFRDMFSPQSGLPRQVRDIIIKVDHATFTDKQIKRHDLLIFNRARTQDGAFGTITHVRPVQTYPYLKHETLKEMAMRLKREYEEEDTHGPSWAIRLTDDRYADEGALPGDYVIWDAARQELQVHRYHEPGTKPLNEQETVKPIGERTPAKPH